MAKGLHKNSLRKVDNPHQWMIDDARMELIQQIKAEVERRKKRNKEEYGGNGLFEVQDNLDSLLSFLSDLEKEEKPINPVIQDFLTTEKEMQDFLATHERIPVPERLNSLERILQEQPVKTNIVEDLKHYLATTPKEQIEKDWESLKEWNKVGPSVSEFLRWEKPVCDGLEEEVDAYMDEHFDYNAEYNSIRLKGNFFPSPSTLLDIARHFAQWGAEHLKK